MPVAPPGAVVYRPVLEWSRGATTHSYRVSDDDRIWFVRALWREGAPRAAVGHTLIQRFASLYPKYPTFTAFLRAYCQPLNPAWFPDGWRHKRAIDRWRKAGKRDKAAAEIERAKRRVSYSVTPWEQIPEQYRTLADRMFAGSVQNPVPTAQHFSTSQAPKGATNEQARAAAEKFATARKLGRPIPVAGGFGPGVNWFFESKGNRPPAVAFKIETQTPGMVVSRTVKPGRGDSAAVAVAVAIGLVALGKKNR